MKNWTTIRMLVLGVSMGALAVTNAHPSLAQNSLGGPAKPKQNAIGGASKPAPVIGGATTSTSVVTKPTAIGKPLKPVLPGATLAPSTTGNAMTPGPTVGTLKQNPPVTPSNKGKTVVTTNLKCGGGACVAKGAKP
jgi:hypothetical protein